MTTGEAAWGSTRLKVRQNIEKEVIKIEGINYSFDLFRGLGIGKCSIALNQPFKILKRKDGVIVIERIKNNK
jgi:hypothetical protein